MEHSTKQCERFYKIWNIQPNNVKDSTKYGTFYQAMWKILQNMEHFTKQCERFYKIWNILPNNVKDSTKYGTFNQTM